MKLNSFHQFNIDASLSKEAENALLREYQHRHDKAALEKVLRANYRYVIALARRFARTSEEHDDCIAACLEAMVKVAPTFDESYGAAFRTYAFPQMMHSMHECMANMRGLSFSSEKSLYMYEKELRNGNEDPSEALLKRIKLHHLRILASLKHVFSLDAPLSSSDEESAEWHQYLDCNHVGAEPKCAADQLVALKEIFEIIVDLKQKLPMRCKEVVTCLYGLDRIGNQVIVNDDDEANGQLVGEQLNISREAVRQHKSKFFKLVRETLKPAI